MQDLRKHLSQLRDDILAEIDGGEECVGRDSMLTQWERQLDDGLRDIQVLEGDNTEMLAALKEAEEAPASCYQVCDWPANGKSSQDAALASVRDAIAKAEGK